MGEGGLNEQETKHTNTFTKLFCHAIFFFKLIIIIINDIYPGSSTHSKVVFREVLHAIELEFGNVDF